MRLLILQYSGDYREAFRRLANGGSETYYAQRYSVETVTKLALQVEQLTFLCCITSESYDELLENGVRAIGAGFHGHIDNDQLIRLLEAQKPTHLVLQMMSREVLQWAIRNRVRVTVILAESIVTQGLRGKVRAFRAARLLNNQHIDWIGSYGLASSLLLQKIGVNPNKIIPWDFLISSTPGSYEPKQLPNSPNGWNLLYVGSMLETKGVGDSLDAVAELRRRKVPVKLKLIGHDGTGFFQDRAAQLAITDFVEFPGIVPNSTIVPLMRESDLVLVPSRHEYTEGFPLVIHHALCARTPIVASNHPMFRLHLKHQVNAMLFPAGNATALANCIESLLSDPDRYRMISEASYDTWYRLRLPVKWADVLNRTVLNLAGDRQWLFDHRLSSGRYKKLLDHPIL